MIESMLACDPVPERECGGSARVDGQGSFVNGCGEFAVTRYCGSPTAHDELAVGLAVRFRHAYPAIALQCFVRW
jgi:hypothetical protein